MSSALMPRLKFEAFHHRTTMAFQESPLAVKMVSVKAIGKIRYYDDLADLVGWV